MTVEIGDVPRRSWPSSSTSILTGCRLAGADHHAGRWAARDGVLDGAGTSSEIGDTASGILTEFIASIPN